MLTSPDPSISPDFLHSEEHFRALEGKVVDLACGYGRHSKMLQAWGCRLICIDRNDLATDYLKSYFGSLISGSETPEIINMDIERSKPLPQVQGLVVVHYYDKASIRSWLQSLQRGGLLYFESITNRGENYLEMPKRDELSLALSKTFTAIHFKQKFVGPINDQREMIRCLMRKN